MKCFFSSLRILIAVSSFSLSSILTQGIDFHPIKFLEKKDDSYVTSVTPDGLWVAGHSGGDPFIYHVETRTMQPLWYTTSHLQSECLKHLQQYYGDSFGNFLKRDLDLSGNDRDPCRGKVCLSKDATVVRWATLSGKLFCWRPDTGIETYRPVGKVQNLIMSSSSDGKTYGYVTRLKQKAKEEVTSRWGLTTICNENENEESEYSQQFVLPAYTEKYNPNDPREMILHGLSADGKLAVGIMYLTKTRGIIHRNIDIPRINSLVLSPSTAYDANPDVFEWDMTKMHHFHNILIPGDTCYPFTEENLKNITPCPVQTVLLGVSPHKKFAVGAMKCYFGLNEESPLYQKSYVKQKMFENTHTSSYKYGVYIHFLYRYNFECKQFEFLANSMDNPLLEEPCYDLKITDDGKTVVGTYQKPGVEIEGEKQFKQTQNFMKEHETAWMNGQAVIWTEKDGLHFLKDWLIKNDVLGYELKKWDLFAATDVTPDGKFLVGYGKNAYGHIQGFHIGR